MNFKQKTTLALAVIALTASNLVAAQTTLLNVSYDVAREFYKDINAAFARLERGDVRYRFVIDMSSLR